MDRRDFIKLLGVSSIAAPFAPYLMGTSYADDSSYSGDLLIFIQAEGGWDSAQLMDPKPDLDRGFTIDDIHKVGGIRYAPGAWSGSGIQYEYARDFFQEFHDQLVVVQGLNMQTNAHRPGQANSFQGSFASGFPSLAAAFCAGKSPELPLGYLVTGSYKSTGQLVPYTSISRPDLLKSIAKPNAATGLPNNLGGLRVPDEVMSMVGEARIERLQTLLRSKELMPRRRQTLEAMLFSATNTRALERLGNSIQSDGLITHDERGARNRIVEQADIVLHAMASGVTCAADMHMRGNAFDSHAHNAERQQDAFAQLLYGVRFLWKRAAEIDTRLGTNISERLTVVLHSEFGRTPQINSDGGTDHWPTTSAMIMRKEFSRTGVGSRTVGYSTNDGRYRPGRINPVTLDRDEAGIELTSAHLHKALRRYFGIADSPILSKYGFPDVEDVSIFSPGLSTPQV